jgi:hypothetical protein
MTTATMPMMTAEDIRTEFGWSDDFATLMRNCQERGFARQGLLMPDKTYLIRFNEGDIVPLRVIAATVETYGDHLAFLRADGRLAALILADIVEEWFEVSA